MSTAIQKLTQAEQWLAEAKTLDDLKEIHDIAIAADAYAKAHKLGLDAENHAMEVRLLAARRIGELCPPEQGKRTDLITSPNFGDVDIQHQRLSEFRKLAEIPEVEFKEKIEDLKGRAEKITYNKILSGNRSNIHFSSKSHEWTTPEIIINKTLQLFGEIDLDPCSNPDFPNIPAKQYFSKEKDGLSQNWSGRVYMNPPYGTEIKKWIFHLAEQFENKNVNEAIALIPSRTDTEWFRRLKAYLHCFIWGRLRFGVGENSAPFPSMVVYFGTNKERFVQIFSNIGDIYELYEST